MNRTTAMSRAAGCSYNVRSSFNHTRYNQNNPWNQNLQPQVPYLQRNIQNHDYQHWCETCDKGFTTARFLENHKLQHQKCNIDGCQFVAHPNIITKHIQMQHSTGLFKRIAKLNNPEDIKKWREERKRKYPTIENMKKKEAEIKEKINRGEKMGIKYERNKKNDKSDMQHKHRFQQTKRVKHPQGKYNTKICNNRKRNATDSSKKSEIPKKICRIVPSMEETRKLKPFSGIQSIKFDDDIVDEITETHCSNLIQDDFDEDIHVAPDIIQNECTTSESTVCNAITSLICCYESSDEGDNEINIQCKGTIEPAKERKLTKLQEVKHNQIMNYGDQSQNNDKVNYLTKSSTKKISQETKMMLQSSKSNVLNCPSYSDDESGPEEIKTIKKETNALVTDCKITSTKLKKEICSKPITSRSNKKCDFKKRNKLPSTLLEKLLHREIQHERNVILQCVRYVVKNNYFENI